MPKLDHEMFGDYFCRKFIVIRFFSDLVRVLSIGRNPIQVLLIRSDPVRVLSIRSEPIRSWFCKRPFAGVFSPLKSIGLCTQATLKNFKNRERSLEIIKWNYLENKAIIRDKLKVSKTFFFQNEPIFKEVHLKNNVLLVSNLILSEVIFFHHVFKR